MKTLSGAAMNKLKVKVVIDCSTCGCPLPRSKTIPVQATQKDAAVRESSEKLEAWKQALVGVNCKVCKSIVESVGR